jgi:hypothetical protein
MNKTTRFLFILLFTFMAAPAFAGTPTQMWACEMTDDATEEAVLAQAEAFVEGARKIPGGENIKARVLFPVAVNSMGNADVWFVVTAPSFEAWGKFWDHFPDSDLADKEGAEDEAVVCPDSALWESTPIG